MGKLRRICLLGSLLALTAAAAVAAPAATVRVTGDCLHEQYEPKQITLACADGGTVVEQLKWSQWSAHGAAGTGVLTVVSCTPSCSAGKPHRYPVRIALSKPGGCRKQPHPAFKQAEFAFEGPKPAKLAARYGLGCPESAVGRRPPATGSPPPARAG